MKCKIVIASILVFSLVACSKSSSETSSGSPENTSSTENATATSSDLSATSTESSSTSGATASSSNLSAKGSSLTGNQSNLNLNLNLSADQLFDFDKAVLKPQADAELQKVFDDINGKTDASVKVVGYTDAKGSDTYNKRLSDQRAMAVKKWLEDKGLKNPILTEGKGAADPIAPNTNSDGSDNPEGRAKNRRVEIKVSGKTSL